MDEVFEKKGYLLEDFRLFHLRDSRGVQTEYHYHEFCKVVILLDGNGSYTVEGRQYPLRPGDLVLLSNGCVHRCSFSPGPIYERIIIYLSPSFLQNHGSADFSLLQCICDAPSPVLRLPERKLQRICALCRSIEHELTHRAPGSNVAATGLLLQLLVELSRDQREHTATWTSPQSIQSPLIRSVVSYLDAHLEQELSIDALADAFYISKFHLMRTFRQETGSTIHTYLTEKRLFLAKSLIQQGLSSTQACYRSGFGSYSSFTRAYSKLFGMTPTGRVVRHKPDDLRE